MSRFDRQSFLGGDSEAILASTTVGIIGLGGGGSHIAQQFAHIGVGGYVLFDPDRIDLSNTNRLIGGKLRDVRRRTAKVKIAKRTILGLQPSAEIKSVQGRWQEAHDSLKDCDLIMGCLDSFEQRDELESFARRHLIPYIDIGMGVHKMDGGNHLIAGQIFLSTPGNPCLRCCRIVTEKKLSDNAGRYGDAGENPQVVWANGVLASSAVALAMQVISPWAEDSPEFAYLEYDGNRGTVSSSRIVEKVKLRNCKHYSADAVGDPFFDIRNYSPGTRKMFQFRAWSMRLLIVRLLGEVFRKFAPHK